MKLFRFQFYISTKSSKITSLIINNNFLIAISAYSDISAYYQQRYAPTVQQQKLPPQHKLHHTHHRPQHNRLNGYPMAPSVCQNSPKLTAGAAHSATMTSTTLIGGAGGGVGAATTISAPSITQKSNYGGSSINGSMASYKMSSSENSWSQPVFNKVCTNEESLFLGFSLSIIFYCKPNA